MHSSCYGLKNTKPRQEPFMEGSSTPSIFSVPYHHVHCPQQSQITSRQPMHEFPATILGHSDRVRHEELQSRPGVLHQAPLLPLASDKFRLGLCENSTCGTPPCYSMSGEEQVQHLPQQNYYSNLKEPSCRPADIGILKADKSKCSEMVNGCGLFGELEEVCNLAKTREITSQPCSSSAATAEHSPQLMPLTASENGNQHPDGHLRGRLSSVSSMKKAERKMKRTRDRKKRKLKEEMRSTGIFFEAILKQVMDHQDFLHRKFLEVTERMERERIEREEEWRQQEARKHEGEETKRARERALALSTEALITTYIQKITGQSPYLTKELIKPDSTKTAGIDRSLKRDEGQQVINKHGLKERFPLGKG